jgi:hypothetical protein
MWHASPRHSEVTAHEQKNYRLVLMAFILFSPLGSVVLLMRAHGKHICSYCNYDTNRAFNLKRHMRIMHGVCDEVERANACQSVENVVQGVENVVHDGGNVVHDGENVVHDGENVVQVEERVFHCVTCYKTFKTKRYFTLHQTNCKKISSELECDICHKQFADRSSLSKHRKRCSCQMQLTAHTPSADTPQPPASHTEYHKNDSVYVNHSKVDTLNKVTNNFILNFPNADETNFSFIKDHVAPQFAQMFMNQKPEIGFRKYAHAILERPENRMVHKTNPNTKYCKVHKCGNWNHELDSEAFPILTNQLSIAALEDFNAVKEKRVERTRLDIARIAKYLDDVNTENDGNENYEQAMERIRLIIINMSQRWGLPVPDIT